MCSSSRGDLLLWLLVQSSCGWCTFSLFFSWFGLVWHRCKTLVSWMKHSLSSCITYFVMFFSQIYDFCCVTGTAGWYICFCCLLSCVWLCNWYYWLAFSVVSAVVVVLCLPWSFLATYDTYYLRLFVWWLVVVRWVVSLFRFYWSLFSFLSSVIGFACIFVLPLLNR